MVDRQVSEPCIDDELGNVIPYGIDIAQNEGYVSVGGTHDTPEFAVATIRRWWAEIGNPTYPKVRAVITADCGGSNGIGYVLGRLSFADLPETQVSKYV